MPTVTVRSRPNGLPMAMTHCPTRKRSESPSSAVGSGPDASTFRTARSVFGSRPTSVADGTEGLLHRLEHGPGVDLGGGGLGGRLALVSGGWRPGSPRRGRLSPRRHRDCEEKEKRDGGFHGGDWGRILTGWRAFTPEG